MILGIWKRICSRNLSNLASIYLWFKLVKKLDYHIQIYLYGWNLTIIKIVLSKYNEVENYMF